MIHRIARDPHHAYSSHRISRDALHALQNGIVRLRAEAITPLATGRFPLAGSLHQETAIHPCVPEGFAKMRIARSMITHLLGLLKYIALVRREAFAHPQ